MGNDFRQYGITQSHPEGVALSRSFLAGVFLWMFLALGITALTAFYFVSTPSLLAYLVRPAGLTPLGWIVMLSPIGFVLIMAFGFQRLSATVLTLLFFIYAVIMGLSFGFIFLMYTPASIFKTFMVTAVMFGIMAVAGYITKIDLSRFGSIMFMGLIGIIIASVVNFFLKSATFDYIISFIGVVVFTGLTAWDVQKLKRIGSGVDAGTAQVRKLTVMGALMLYLDFINLFLFLLRFMGNRR
jgi:FtsH-binding integral membrane protein